MRTRLLLTFAVLVVVGVALAGPSSAAVLRQAAPTTPRIVIAAFSYVPDPAAARPGQRVSAINLDSQVVPPIPGHSITADSGAFDTGVFRDTASFRAPTRPGVYRYHCVVHFFMHGVLVVR